MPLTLALPWPPPANNLYPTSGRRRILSTRGQVYQIEFRAALARQVRRFEPMAGRVGYRVRFMPPDNRRRDLSNLLKALEDNLTKCQVWVDDSQVDDGHFTRGPVVKGGRVEIEIWQITPAATSAQLP